jgi:SecD/SecF fusion protein
VLLVIGGYFFIAERHTIFGMDFTGGYALTVDIEEKPDMDYRDAVAEALANNGAAHGDYQVRELNTPHNLRIQLGMSMEQPGHPFYGLPLQKAGADVGYAYEQNPRIMWVVKALSDSGISIKQSQLVTLEQNWNEMSGQLSDAMRNSALIGLGLALLCILIYITIRFEFNYAISALIGLGYDIVVTVAILALLHAFGLGVQIDLQVIAAIVTIVAYSLNDTIIIFDRIREDLKRMRKMKYLDVVNHALNATLSRTLMTSGTTFLVLLAMVFLGGSTIFDFSLVMTIGVVVGTLSSLFIAAPLMLYFHHRDASQQEKDSKTTVARVRTSNTQ